MIRVSWYLIIFLLPFGTWVGVGRYIETYLTEWFRFLLLYELACDWPHAVETVE